MTGLEAPVLAAIIGGVATAGTAVYSTIASNKQADKAAARQTNYYNTIAAQDAATAAEEKRISQEALQRQRAYSASLLNTDTSLSNVLSGSYTEENYGGGSLLGHTLGGSSVDSIFA